MKQRADGLIDLDTRDVDRWIGVPLGGGRLKDPIHPNDLRRWAQGMQNPNPLYFDEAYAAASRYGRLVAPQSFAVCTDTSHGAVATHGSPWDYDRRVPILSWRAGFRGATVNTPADTVDIMPTLAALIDLPLAPGTVDGHCLDGTPAFCPH